MAGTKVPTDPNMTPEVKRFLDERVREAAKLEERIAELESDTPEFAEDADAQAGTSTALFMNPAVTVTAIKAFAPFLKFIHVQDQKATNTDGGASTAGTFLTRDLNTVLYNGITGASLALNEITLPAGVYYVDASAPAYNVTGHVAQLVNVSAATTLLIGTTEHASANTGGAAGMTRSHIRGRFTLGSTQNIRVEHRTANNAGAGFGSSFNSTVASIYTDIIIWKMD